MPRIRTIKPDAFLSESLSEVPRGTRWTFAGLWTYADDAGRARDDARLIKAALYPLDDSVSLDDVRTDLWLLVGIGAICRYVVDDRSYLHMPKWGHQKINRPTPARNPPCPLHEGGTSGHVLDPDDSLSTHRAVTDPSGGEVEVEVEQGREGIFPATDVATETHPDLARFDDFWNTYGKKVDRKTCERLWQQALKKRNVTADRLVTAAAAYVLHERTTNQGGRYIMDPSRWLRNERWNDERPAVPPPLTNTQSHLSLVERLAAEQQPGLREIGGGR